MYNFKRDPQIDGLIRYLMDNVVGYDNPEYPEWKIAIIVYKHVTEFNKHWKTFTFLSKTGGDVKYETFIDLIDQFWDVYYKTFYRNNTLKLKFTILCNRNKYIQIGKPVTVNFKDKRELTYKLLEFLNSSSTLSECFNGMLVPTNDRLLIDDVFIRYSIPKINTESKILFTL